ncbi:MAG: hypothetical protein A2V70_11120 [Planctomycetes bacterium RBG_13_63_9]|nr:MAG: hypothetical protein A2V70_11120 [Planctomycetes bacterium RBG_13_63_9]
MDWVSSEVVSIIYYLLPGFVAAWVFYGLTAHPKASPFERVVQALIFTVIVQTIVAVIGWILRGLGRIGICGSWSQECALIWSVVVALLIGLVFAWLANKNSCHALFRKWGITSRTSFPSEWFSVLSQADRWVVLHLTGGRRLYGWPVEWPDHPDAGHFVIDQPEWLLDDGRRIPLDRVDKILVPASDIEMVEFLKRPREITAGRPDLDKADAALIELQKKEGNHGKQSTPAGSEPSAE